MKTVIRSLWLSLLIGVPAMGASLRAAADPVIAPGGKPGVAASWRTVGDKTTLTISLGHSPEAVSEAIGKHIAGAAASVQEGKVVVTGIPEAKLLRELEKVDVLPAQGDDVDTMLAALQNPGGDEGGSGSSIRATKAADLSEVLGDKQALITAKVISVRRARYPLVFVTVKVSGASKGGIAATTVKRGDKITVLPRVKSKNGIVDPEDPASKLNVGAWYAQPGDTVILRLEEEKKDQKIWVAAAFDRNPS